MDLPERADGVGLDAAFVGVVERDQEFVRMLGVELVFELRVGDGERDGVLEEELRRAVRLFLLLDAVERTGAGAFSS